MSYSPEWMRKTRDDVPASNTPPSRNVIFEQFVADAVKANEITIKIEVKNEGTGTTE